MTYLKSWEEFERAAERLYLQDPIKVTMKHIGVSLITSVVVRAWRCLSRNHLKQIFFFHFEMETCMTSENSPMHFQRSI